MLSLNCQNCKAQDTSLCWPHFLECRSATFANCCFGAWSTRCAYITLFTPNTWIVFGERCYLKGYHCNGCGMRVHRHCLEKLKDGYVVYNQFRQLHSLYVYYSCSALMRRPVTEKTVQHQKIRVAPGAIYESEAEAADDGRLQRRSCLWYVSCNNFGRLIFYHQLHRWTSRLPAQFNASCNPKAFQRHR